MISTTYQVDGFPENDAFWRIECFGGVSYNPRVPSEHLIETALALVPHDSGNKIQLKNLSAHTERIIVQVGIGYLPYLALGTIWQNRRPATCELSIPEKTFQIDVNTQKYISTDKWINGSRVIPVHIYPFERNWHVAKDTKLVAIEYEGDPYGLLIPALELFRFYYATSTNLAKAACWGEFPDAYDPEKSGRLGDGNFRVHLRQHMSKHDAWTLARFIHSPVMQHQMQQFHRQIQTAQINAGLIPIAPTRNLECGFPFTGNTTIRGRAINVSDGANPRWLVLRLTGCAKPLPFGNVVADKDDNYIEGPGGEGSEGLPEIVRHIHPPSDKIEPVDVLKSDAEPSRNLRPLGIQLPEDRFDGLKGKKLITPPAKERGNTSIRVVSTATEIIDGLGSGDGTWGNSTRKQVRLHNIPKEEIQPKQPKETLPVNLENFISTMRLLREKHGFSGNFIGTGDNDIRDDENSIFATFPRFNPHTKRSLKWPVLNNGDLRRLIIAKIVVNEKTAYALEIERGLESEHYSTLVISNEDFKDLSKEQWRKFMLQCALNNRWPTEFETKTIRRATTSHKGFVSVAVFADRIWLCVTEVLGIKVTVELKNDQI